MRARDALLRHWPLKLTALALSAILWVVVALEQPATHLEDIQVVLTLSPATALAQPLPTVQALIAGPRGEFLKLSAAPLLIRASIPESAGTRSRIYISPSDVELPRDAKVTVQEVQPREIDVVLDRRAEKTVPVAVRATVEPESGWALEGPVVAAPAAIRVSGARSLLGALDSVATMPVDLKGIAGEFRRTVPLDTSGRAVLEMTPPAVTLTGKTSKS